MFWAHKRFIYSHSFGAQFTEGHASVSTDPQERLTLVQKVAEEHQQYQSHVHEFQKRLVLLTDEVSRFTEIEDVSENRLQALQVLLLAHFTHGKGEDVH